MTKEEQKNRIRLALSQFLTKEEVDLSMPKLDSDNLMDLITTKGGLGTPTLDIEIDDNPVVGGDDIDVPVIGGEDIPVIGGEDIPVIGGEDGREGGSGSGSGSGSGDDDDSGSGSGSDDDDDSGSGSDDEEEDERRYKVGDKVRIKGRSGDNVGVVTAINPDGTYVIKKVKDKEDIKFSDGGSIDSGDDDETFNEDEIEPFVDFREGLDELIEQLTFAKNYSFKLDSFIRMVAVDHISKPEYNWFDDGQREQLINELNATDTISQYVWDKISDMVQMALKYFYWYNLVKKIKKSKIIDVFIDASEKRNYFGGIEYYFSSFYIRGANNSRIDGRGFSVQGFSFQEYIDFFESVSSDTDYNVIQERKGTAIVALEQFSSLYSLDSFYFKIIAYGCISNPNLININYFLQEHFDLLFSILQSNEFTFTDIMGYRQSINHINYEKEENKLSEKEEKEWLEKPISTSFLSTIGVRNIFSIIKDEKTLKIIKIDNYSVDTSASNIQFYTNNDFLDKEFKTSTTFKNMSDYITDYYAEYEDLFDLKQKNILNNFSNRLSKNMVLFVKDSLNKLRSLTNEFREYF